MKHTKFLTTVTSLLLLVPLAGSPDEIFVPNSFRSGTTIRSAEMNENFSVVQTGINQHAQQIAAVEEELSVVGTSIDDLRLSVDTNGEALVEIASLLADIGDTLSSIDTTLTETSAITDLDQLICRGSPRNFTTELLLCLQASSSAIRNLTMAQILVGGWKAVTVGGSDDYYSLYIFHR